MTQRKNKASLARKIVSMMLAVTMLFTVLLGTIAAAEEVNQVLVYETEVNSSIIRFYLKGGTQYHSYNGVIGEPILIPMSPEAPEGFMFAYWYQVDDELQGDAGVSFDFKASVSGALNLMAVFTPVVADEPVAEEPVAEEPVAEEPVAEEPVVEEPVAEEPVAEEPVAEEPTAEEPVAEEPVAEEPAAEEPIMEEPVAEEPVAEEPVAEEPIADEPVAEEPVAEEPIAEEPVAEEPVAEEPVAEEPVIEEPMIEEPVADEPVETILIPRSVEIITTLSTVINEGETVTMTGILTGFDDVQVLLQWQFNDGTGWHDIQGAEGGQYSYIASYQTVNNDWRLRVTITD